MDQLAIMLYDTVRTVALYQTSKNDTATASLPFQSE
jgi:hypothetical protein